MPKAEIEITSIAELKSMIAAFQITEGRAKPKKQARKRSYEEIIRMR